VPAKTPRGKERSLQASRSIGLQMLGLFNTLPIPSMSSSPLPTPPLHLLQRTGFLGDEATATSYHEVGASGRAFIEELLPDDWSWDGKRVLDFGCGAGKVLRHFAPEATIAEFTGCDIHAPSIDWLQRNLSPPFNFFHCSEEPKLPQPDGYFDLIYAISVYTHLTDRWAEWLLEHHRVLAPNGLLMASFLGEGMIELLIGERWDENKIGMNTLWAGKPWDDGGPITLHSPWWLRAHWGRAFEVVRIVPHAGNEIPEGHGLILLRRKPVQLSPEELRRLEPGEEREIEALEHQAEQLRRETVELRAENAKLRAAATSRIAKTVRLAKDIVRRRVR
jgi:SAM-dependent methyltransferase